MSVSVFFIWYLLVPILMMGNEKLKIVIHICLLIILYTLFCTLPHDNMTWFSWVPYIFFFMLGALSAEFHHTEYNDNFIMVCLLFSIVHFIYNRYIIAYSFIFAVVFVVAPNITFPFSTGKRIYKLLGELSYLIFLAHPLFIDFYAYFPIKSLKEIAFFQVGFIILGTLALSSVLYVTVQKPFMLIGKHLDQILASRETERLDRQQ